MLSIQAEDCHVTQRTSHASFLAMTVSPCSSSKPKELSKYQINLCNLSFVRKYPISITPVVKLKSGTLHLHLRNPPYAKKLSHPGHSQSAEA